MKKTNIFLLILVLASLLRVWALDKVPPELFGDELDVGYHAYSLLKTGRDYYGQFLPTYIHSFSEWRAPLLMYVTVPFIATFGLNEWGLRLPSAVFGVISVWLMYLVIRNMKVKNSLEIKNYKLEIEEIAALFLAISPWHLQYSRAAFEVSLLLTLILAGVLLFLKSFKKPYLLTISTVIFALTFYTYSTANIFTPSLLLLLLILYRSDLKKVNLKHKVSSVLVFAVLSLPIAYSIIFGSAAERFRNFSVFNDEIIISEINNERIEGGLTFVETLAHNKIIYFGRQLLANYTSAFSPRFLFVEGDITFRHSIHRGEMFWVFLPLLLIGLFSAVRSKDKRNLFWLGWLLIAPIPAALTRDGAVHATRLFVMLPPLIYFSSLGFQELLSASLSAVLRRGLLALFLLGLMLESFLYLHQYYIHYPRQSWRWWHMGYKDSLVFMKEIEGDYQTVIFNNSYEPTLVRFLFWWKYPPNKFINEFTADKEEADILPGFRGFKLEDKYYFGTAKEAPAGVIGFVKPGMLYLVSQRDEVGGDWDWEKNTPNEIRVLKAVRNPYNEPIFYIVTGK